MKYLIFKSVVCSAGITMMVSFLNLKAYFLVLRSGMTTESEFNEFEPRLKSAKTRFELSAGLNLETFDTILSRTNHI